MSRANSLKVYIISRLLLIPPMIWTITTVVFFLMRVMGGDPADIALGPRALEADKAAWRAVRNLDGSIFNQYIDYLKQLCQFNLGESLLAGGETVWEIIGSLFPATVELSMCGLLVAAVVGLTVGSVAASRPNTVWDGGGRLFGIVTYAIPMYWFGMILQIIFSVKLGWFPIGTRFPVSQIPPAGPTGLYLLDSLLHLNLAQLGTTLYYLTLPSLTLGILISGVFERIVRVNLRQTLKADYVEAARARGIPEFKIVTAHALKNAMIPVITILGLTFASLLGGAVLTEVTFSWPGLANRLFEAIIQRDYFVVQGLMVFFGIIVALVSIGIDILNAYVDPRIRY